jgi:hypothetical protein
MKHIIQLVLFTFLCNLLSNTSLAQTDDSLKIKPLRYITTGAGLSHSSYRDLGVSPLTYSSWLGNIQLGYRSEKPHSILEIHSLADAGVYETNAGGSFYRTQAINVRSSVHYFLNFPTHNNIRFFMGGGITHCISARSSAHYMNAGFVIDNYALVSINSRIQRSFTIPSVERKIWFLNYKKPDRTWTASATLYMPFSGVLLRPGFSYVSHSTTNDDEPLGEYQWHALVFSGTSARISLTRYLANGNAYEFGYDFHVFTSKNYIINSLQMATQTFGFSLNYRFK